MYILGSDFDGTLNYGGVNEATRRAIRRFRDAGNLFGVVTGRDYWAYKMLKDDGIEFDFVLPFNGGMAVDGEGNILFETRTENRGSYRRILEIMARGWNEDVSCVLGKERRTCHFAYPEGNENYSPLTDADLPVYTMLNTRCRTDDEAAKAVAEINAECGDIVHALQNGGCIDIPPVGVDKGSGLAKYADMMGVPYENVYTAGDNMNDMAMITRFHGCAVSNAREEIKQAAEIVSDRISDIIDCIMEQAKQN